MAHLKVTFTAAGTVDGGDRLFISGHEALEERLVISDSSIHGGVTGRGRRIQVCWFGRIPRLRFAAIARRRTVLRRGSNTGLNIHRRAGICSIILGSTIGNGLNYTNIMAAWHS